MEKKTTPRPGYMGYDEYMALRKRQEQKANEALGPAPVARESVPGTMPRRASAARRPTATSPTALDRRPRRAPDRPRRQDTWAPSIDLDSSAPAGVERFRDDPPSSADSPRPDPWREDSFSPSPEIHARPRQKIKNRKPSKLRLADDNQRDLPFEDWLDTDGKLGSGKFESVPMEEALEMLRRADQRAEADVAAEQMDAPPAETPVATTAAEERADLDESTVVVRHPDAKVEHFAPSIAPEVKESIAPESKAPVTQEAKEPLAEEVKTPTTPEPKESPVPEAQSPIESEHKETIAPEFKERTDAQSEKETLAVSTRMDPPSSEPVPQTAAAIRTVVFEPEVSRLEKSETPREAASVVEPQPGMEDRQTQKETATAKTVEAVAVKIPIETRPASVLLPIDEDAEQNEPLFVPLDRRTGIILAGMALCVVAIIVLLVLFL